MTLSSSFHIFFRRGAVSLQSLIDFSMRLLFSRFDNNLGHPGRGSSLLTYFSCILMMSFIVLLGIFNCFNIALDGSLSWCKVIL